MKQNTDKKKAKLFTDEPLLMQYHEAIEGRHDYYQQRLTRLLGGRRRKLSSFANGHLYYGLHRMDDRSWVFREWLPNAERVVLIGDFNGWKEEEGFALKRINAGRRVWREAACLVPTCGTGFAHDAILSSGLVSGSTLPIQGENLLSLSGAVANL